MNSKAIPIRPFVKWAGGKSQLLKSIRPKYPIRLGSEINKYCEPFVGGGAVLFDILSQFELDEILINDINPELINTYHQIQNNFSELVSRLDSFQRDYQILSQNERKTVYLQRRDEFNNLKQSNDADNVQKAALFIFLNRTCFNGLYRVNKKGLFNVPIGSYKNPLICDKENLSNLSKLLKNVQIQCSDYRNCLSFIDSETFVYIDPPYRPLSQTSSFTAYAETAFNDNNQIELSQFVHNIHNKGARVLISNSDPKNEDLNDSFFDNLYAGYNIKRVSAKRIINCNAENRGEIKELLIDNNY